MLTLRRLRGRKGKGALASRPFHSSDCAAVAQLALQNLCRAPETRLDAGHAAYLKWLYPGARFLMLVRNPLTAYASLKRRGPAPTDFAATWSRLAVGFHGFEPDASAVLVRYEGIAEQAEAIRSHVGARTIARPGDLDDEDGDETARNIAALGFLERRRLAAGTRDGRDLLGYARDI